MPLSSTLDLFTNCSLKPDSPLRTPLPRSPLQRQPHELHLGGNGARFTVQCRSSHVHTFSLDLMLSPCLALSPPISVTSLFPSTPSLAITLPFACLISLTLIMLYAGCRRTLSSGTSDIEPAPSLSRPSVPSALPSHSAPVHQPPSAW